MSYAIGYIIYGIDFNRSFDEFNQDIYELVQNDYLQSHYSGNGESPCYVGVKLCSIDEANAVDISRLKLSPTNNDLHEYENKLKDLLEVIENEKFKEVIQETLPTTFITWGSS